MLRSVQSMKVFRRCATAGFFLVLFSGSLAAQDGAGLYKKNCDTCHDSRIERVPDPEVLRAMTPEQVLAAMENGPMISMAARLTGAGRRAIAEYVTGKSFGQALQMTPSSEAMCAGRTGEPAPSKAASLWDGWGNGLTNTRFQM